MTEYISNISGYNKWGYTSEGYIIYQKATPKLTTDQPYNQNYGRLLKAYVQIWNKDETELLHEYDMFNPDASTLVADGLSLTMGLQNNSFVFKFFDGEKFIDAKDIRYGKKVKIWASKDSSNLHPMMIGYTTDRVRIGIGPNAREYHITGIGEQARTSQLVALLQRAAKSLGIGGGITTLPDEQMTVSNLYRELYSKTDVRLGGGRAIKDILNLDLSGIDDSVDQFVSSMNEFGKVNEISNKLAELGGVNWRIFFGKLFVEYPKAAKPSLTIKSLQEQGDTAADTAYILQDQAWEDRETTGEGHATTLYVPTRIDAKQVAGEANNNAAMTLLNRIIAQRFDAIDTRFNTLFVKLSRKGDPSGGDLDKVLKGRIVTDDTSIPGIPSSPTGTVIKEFEISPGTIDDIPANIFVNDLNIDRSLASPNGKYWLQLGPFGFDFYNTAYWHHDNIINRPGQYSAWATIIGDDISTVNWRILNSGPTMNFGIFSTINRMQRYDADTTIDLIGEVEEIEQYPFLEDAISTTKMMQNVLSYRSLVPKRLSFKITIPDEVIPMPGLYAATIDEMIDAELADFLTAEIQETTIDFIGPGATDMTVRMLAFADPLEDEL